MRKSYSIRLDPDLVQQLDEIRPEGTRSELLEKLISQYIEDQHQPPILEEKQKKITTLQQKLHETEDYSQQIKVELETTKKQYIDIQQQLQEKQKEADQLHNKYETKLETLQQQHKEELHEKDKKITKKDGDYKHQVEVNNKLQTELNTANKKLEKYSYFFGAVTKMSWWNRLLGNYPEEILELQPAQFDEENKQ